MTEHYFVALLARVARIQADALAAVDLERAGAEAGFPLGVSMRRGRAALLDAIDGQVSELRRVGGLLLLRWSA